MPYHTFTPTFSFSMDIDSFIKWNGSFNDTKISIFTWWQIYYYFANDRTDFPQKNDYIEISMIYVRRGFYL